MDTGGAGLWDEVDDAEEGVGGRRFFGDDLPDDCSDCDPVPAPEAVEVAGPALCFRARASFAGSSTRK